MYYNKPSYKKEKLIGFEEGYNFKGIDSIKLTVETNVGGWENQEPSKNDGFLIVKKGMGTARIQGKSHVLTAGTLLEVPQGVLVEMGYSQLKYYGIKATNGQHVTVTQEKNEGGWKAFSFSSADRVLVVKKGVGFAKINNKTYRLEEEGVLEVPANTLIDVSGPFEYFCVSSENK